MKRKAESVEFMSIIGSLLLIFTFSVNAVAQQDDGFAVIAKTYRCDQVEQGNGCAGPSAHNF
jgi:hypothetical protein